MGKKGENQSTAVITIVVVVVFLGLAMLNGGGKSSSTSRPTYESSSPYAPSWETQRGIDQMEGTLQEKVDAKHAVERFNKAAADRGERPTGL